MRYNFPVRHSNERTYLYRFAVPKNGNLYENSDYFHSKNEDNNEHNMLRNSELYHCLPLQDQPFITERKFRPFDPEKAQKCLKIFEGSHNMYAVASGLARKTKINKKLLKSESEIVEENNDKVYQQILFENDYFIRTIDEVTFEKVPPPMSEKLVPIYEHFDFYQFTVRGPNFFRNQIHRMARNFSHKLSKITIFGH